MPRQSKHKSTQPKFGKGLDKPIRVPSPPMVSILDDPKKPPKKIDDWLKRCSEIRLEGKLTRMATLIEYYGKQGVDVNDPWSILIHVADDYIPSFQVETSIPKGRKNEWAGKKNARLWYDVESRLSKRRVKIGISVCMGTTATGRPRRAGRSCCSTLAK